VPFEVPEGPAGGTTLSGERSRQRALRSHGEFLATGHGGGGNAQGDTLFNIENLTGSAFNDTLEGNAGNNVLAGGVGIDLASFEHAAAGVNVSLAVTAAQNTLGAGTDTLSGFENLTGSCLQRHADGQWPC
jgi:Ca2+-binding RTX toxin-like protein